MRLNRVTKNDENVKRGRTAKRKGAQFERTLAKKFQGRYGIELKRTPQSGGFAKTSSKADDYRGDIVVVDSDYNLKVHIEAKNQKTWKLKQWIEQAEEDCPEGKTPIVVFHQHDSSRDYVCLSLEGFFDLVDTEHVLEKKGGLSEESN